MLIQKNNSLEGNAIAEISEKKLSSSLSTSEKNTYLISEFRNCKDTIPQLKSHTWSSFCDEYSEHKISDKKDGPAWSPVNYLEGTTRHNKNVSHISMAVMDIDDGTPLDEIITKLSGFTCLIHSSYSHSEEKAKYRVVMPLSEPISSQAWPAAWAQINQLIAGHNDPATKDAARLYYKPAKPRSAPAHFVRVIPGVPFVVTELPKAEPAIVERPIVFYGKKSNKPFSEIEGIESSGFELNFKQGLSEVVSRCAFMQFAAAPENQAEMPEPLWMAMMSNACRFEESESWIHTASKHHPEYVAEETEGRIERYRNGPPPVTCQRIRELGFQGCPSDGCQKPTGLEAKAPAGLYGWMFHHQLNATAATSELPVEYDVDSFSVKPGGVFQTKVSKDNVPAVTRISSRIDVVALTRDQDSTNWGMELQFKDPDGVLKRWALPRELLASGGDSYRASLLKMGAVVETSKAAREGLAEYLVAASPEGRALSVRQPGWFNGLFVLPNAVYGSSSERVVFQTNDPDDIKRFTQKGTLQSWQEHVAGPCQGNSRAVVSLCIGLAPPALSLLGEDNGGFHFRGNSSIGKSVCLQLGSSIWGGPALIRTWNMTSNGLEGIATMHNDILLPLDELGQADGKAAGDAAYMLGNGQGKSRANRDGDARTAKRFRNLVLSSGERSLSDLMSQAGQSTMAGQEVRMVDIAADAGCGLGVFDNIHGARSSQVFAETLKSNVLLHHGQAGRALVEILSNAEQQPRLIEKLKNLMQGFVDTYVPTDATGQVGRVGRRFALIAAVGELCIELGILPWPEGDAIDGAVKCFESWIEQRGGAGNHESAQAIAQVRRFIEQHGESRFTAWNGTNENDVASRTINRVGFRRVCDDGRTEYFILPEAYKQEVCRGLDSRYVTSVLSQKRYLSASSAGASQVEIRLPGIGKKRVYHLNAHFIGGDVSQDENHETAVRHPLRSEASMKYIV